MRVMAVRSQFAVCNVKLILGCALGVVLAVGVMELGW